MTAARPWALLLLIGVVGFAPARGRAAVCGAGSADAAMLEDTWTAMDAACPCAAATDHHGYTRCANDVVMQRHHDGLLSSACRSVARKRASQSTCGRAGAAVCCRTTGTLVRGRIVRTADRCKSTAHTSACVADPSNVVQGCTATGCVACGNGVVDPGEECEAPTPNCVACHFDTCGNGILDPGEECDPPGVDACLPGCRYAVCGDGVVEGPEQCEPPDSPGCTDDCQTGTCAAPPSGETAVACVSRSSAVAVAAGPGGALVAWDSVRSLSAINGRRLDASGVPIEPMSFEVSEPVATGGPFAQGGPEIGGDASGWYVSWSGSGPLPVYRVGGARVDATGAVASRQVLAQATTFGMCFSGIGPALGVVAEQPDQVTALWGNFAGCFNSFMFDWHSAARMTFSGGQLQSTTGIGVEPTGPPPPVSSDPSGGLASGGGDTVATFVSAFADWSSGSPVVVDSGLFAWWLPPTAAHVKLSSAPSSTVTGPGVAWGSASFLVAWAQPGVSGSDVRALRFTRAAGPLDPDGGLVLATGTSAVGPLRVAFDGTSWLVVWLAQTGPGLYDVLGVGVRPDGTIVDASPRLLAAGVSTAPSITPWSGGWLLGVVRAAGANLVSVNVAPIAD